MSRPHDPLVCGIDRDSDCDACLADRLALADLRNPHEAAAVRWEQLAREAEKIREGTDPLELPAPLPPKLLGRVLWTLLQPPYRPVLREVIMDLLAEPIAELVAVLHRETT